MPTFIPLATADSMRLVSFTRQASMTSAAPLLRDVDLVTSLNMPSNVFQPPEPAPFLGYQLPCCYLLKECLGSTVSGGQLWVATRVTDGTTVVLKILVPGVIMRGTASVMMNRTSLTTEDEAASQRCVSRAKTEAVMLKHVSPHPFIVDFVEQFAAEDVVVTVTKRVEGRNLSEQLQSMKSTGRHFTEAEACVLITQLLLALKHCHDRDVVHRDVRMSNIFLHTSGLLRLGDFDRAKWATNNAPLAIPTFAPIPRGTSDSSASDEVPGTESDDSVPGGDISEDTTPLLTSLFPVKERGGRGTMVFSTSTVEHGAVGNSGNNGNTEGLNRVQQDTNVALPAKQECNIWCVHDDDAFKAVEFQRLEDTGRKVTPYTAPELLLPEGTCTPKSDVWAAGIVLFQLLTGAPPFEGQSQAEMRMSIARGLRGPQWDALSHRAKHVLQGMLNPCSACRWDANTALRCKYLQGSLRALKSAVRPHHGQVTPELGDDITRCIDACLVLGA